jgi:hypothetical protein
MGHMKFILLLVLVACANSKKVETALSLDIEERHQSPATQETRLEILHLARKYDLSSFLYTKKIIIDPTVEKTKWKPEIILNTKYKDHPHRLMGQLLHEELHWWMRDHKQNVQVAIPELKKTFPGIPKMRGAKDPDSTTRHLLICWMEFRALAKYFGEEDAADVLKHNVKEKHFPWIYSTVLKDHRKIEKIVRKYEFIPDELYPKVNLLR